ncbi:unnamed protein product [Ixodes hexagonus]
MFRRKLTALGFHSPDTFNVQSKYRIGQLRSLVAWLEDQKIRHYKLEQRGTLRQIEDPGWVQAFHTYLQDLGCPHDAADERAVLDWLLGLAVHLEYSDTPDKFAVECEPEDSKGPTLVHTNPLDSMDFESVEFRQGVAALSQLLGVSPHPDHLVTLQAVCSLVQDRLAPGKKQAGIQQNMFATMSLQGKPYPLKESALGFDSGDPVLNQAAKVLRLLYVHDLRDLQTRINEAIVAVQTITANPKTDTRLGKVGR